MCARKRDAEAQGSERACSVTMPRFHVPGSHTHATEPDPRPNLPRQASECDCKLLAQGWCESLSVCVHIHLYLSTFLHVCWYMCWRAGPCSRTPTLLWTRTRMSTVRCTPMQGSVPRPSRKRSACCRSTLTRCGLRRMCMCMCMCMCVHVCVCALVHTLCVRVRVHARRACLLSAHLDQVRIAHVLRTVPGYLGVHCAWVAGCAFHGCVCFRRVCARTCTACMTNS